MNKKGNSIIKRYFIFIVISGMMFQAGLILPTQDNSSFSYDVSADSVCNKLMNNQAETTITCTGTGADTSAKLSIPKGSDILSASFKVTGYPDQDKYPSRVKIDVGDDGNLEWEFNLTSAGALGKQTEFIGSIQKKSLTLNTSDYDTSLKIRLPRSANILTANLNVEGFFHGILNGDLETGDMTGWNIDTNQYSDTVMVSKILDGDYPSSTWGANNYYLMLRSNPFGSHDGTCNIIVESDSFRKLFTQYVTMDWDLLDNDDFDLFIHVRDENTNQVIAREYGFVNDWPIPQNNTEKLTKQVINIQSLSGNYPYIYLRLRDGGWGSGPDWGRLSVDNIFISDAFGNPLPNYPTDVSIDVGNDGTKEYTKASLTGSDSVSGLKNALVSLLATPSPACQATTDKYGNEYLDIPLNVSILSSQGMINITDLDITYEYSAKVDENPKGSLTDELNSLIPDSGVGNVNIPIAIWSSTPGKIKISDIDIQYNVKPSTSTIPSLDVLEDSVNPHKLNLEDYFSDDSGTEPLVFEVASNSRPDNLEAIIEEGKYLTINANKVPDWYGDVTLLVRATDHYGLTVESNAFKVQVLPVNDEPRVNVPLPKVTLWEDGDGISIALDDVSYFVDIEGDKLFYSIKIDPDGTLPDLGQNLSVTIGNNNNLFIVQGKDWYGTNIPIRLYCDDDRSPIDMGSNDPHQEFFIDVLPINDPPELEPFDTIYIDEDEDIDNYIYLGDVATDVETSSENLIFTILSNDNKENILVTIDPHKYLDISILTTDYVGTAKIKLQVMDENFATDEESFKILINSINDDPRILQQPYEIEILEDTIDSTSINLYDIFFDPDSPITYSFIGNQHISVSITEETGYVTFKPEKDWSGSEYVIFTAVDSYVESGSSEQIAKITLKVIVLPVNDPPQTPKIISPLDPRTNTAEHNVFFKSEEAIDIDTTGLHYYWDFDDRVDSNEDGDPTNDQDGIGREIEYNYSISGYYYVTLYVSDGELNCSPPAGIYVKVTTDFDEVVKSVEKKSSSSETEMLLSLPFIILLIVLIIWILLVGRKSKRKPKEGAPQEPSRSEPPPVLDGELVSEPKLPPKAKVMIVADHGSTPTTKPATKPVAKPTPTPSTPVTQTVIHKPSATPVATKPATQTTTPAPTQVNTIKRSVR